MKRVPARGSLDRAAHGIVFLAVVLMSATASGEEENGLILVDGISVITGSRTSNESDATPVLLSDVAFEAALILAATEGPGAALGNASAQDWQRARRQAVLIRLLAAQARYLHELATPSDTRAIAAEITAMVGGQSAMAKILARLGLGFQELTLFSETAALALTQIRYFEEQVDIPTGRDRPGGAPSKRGDGITERLRQMVNRDRTEQQIRKWISDLMDNGHIRMVR